MAGKAETWYNIYMEVGAPQPNKAKKSAPQRRGWIILLCLLGLLLALGAFLARLYHGVSPIVRWEYGEGLPPATAFCQEADAEYRFAEDQPDLGTYLIDLQADGRTVPCLLIVEDTIAPTAYPVNLDFPAGHEPTPDEFITDLWDADRVAVSFTQAYDFSAAGEHKIVILLEDGSGNRSKVRATATVRATRDTVTVEAGSPAPASEAFCEEGFCGTLLTKITEAMLCTPGAYPLDIQCADNGKVYPSTLLVRDTVAPLASGRLLALQLGEAVAPEDFLTGVADETDLSFSFVVAPDPDRRDLQDILVRVTDSGGNAVDVDAQVFYSSLQPVTVEAKNGLLTPEDVGAPGWEVEAFPADQLGTYPVGVHTANGEAQLVLVTLVDTTAPVLTPVTGTFYTKHILSPGSLVSASDVTEVSLEYASEPDWNTAGEQSFRVKATDASGNESTVDLTVTLLSDDVAPALYGVVDRTCYVDEPILYLKETYAEDDVDAQVELTVDSQVIPSQPGKYAVTYTAADQSGNVTVKSCTYTLVKPAVSEAQLDELVAAALKKIIKPNMVKAEQLKAVYEYVQKLIEYTGTSDKTDWRKEAVRGLTKRRGDCFTFYSVSRALLDKLDIPYMSVTRLGGATRHYWLIVNIGTGWYHFDTLVNTSGVRCFMWNEKQAKDRSRYYYRFNEEEYPPIATEQFNYKAVVQMEKKGLLP